MSWAYASPEALRLLVKARDTKTCTQTTRRWSRRSPDWRLRYCEGDTVTMTLPYRFGTTIVWPVEGKTRRE